MGNDSIHKKAIEVIRSCRSVEQLDTCEVWVGQLDFDGDYLEQDSYIIDLKVNILEMRRYLDRLADIQNIDTTGANND